MSSTAQLLTSSGDTEGSYEWGTPDNPFLGLSMVFGPFDLDPAATPENAKAQKFYTKEDDGLIQPWFGNVFCNPPYGRGLGKWVKKAFDEVVSERCATATLLIPASTSTRWFHEYAHQGWVWFVKGRIKFIMPGKKNGATFSNMILHVRLPLVDPEDLGGVVAHTWDLRADYSRGIL